MSSGVGRAFLDGAAAKRTADKLLASVREQVAAEASSASAKTQRRLLREKLAAQLDAPFDFTTDFYGGVAAAGDAVAEDDDDDDDDEDDQVDDYYDDDDDDDDDDEDDDEEEDVDID